MDSKHFQRRILCILVLLALIMTSLGTALYDLQINNGEEYYQQSQRKILESQTVEAARGQILDRNGRVLVSNRVVYQVMLDTSPMKEDRNQIILSLIQVCREEGVEWTDTLPISHTQPFTFTTETPYYSLSLDEEGNTVKTLTQLGRLSLAMGWLEEDPTKDPQPDSGPQEEEEPEQPGLWDQIKSFFSGGSSDSDLSSSSSQEQAPASLPTAEELLGKMCASFSLAGEGAVDAKAAKAAGEEVPALNIGDMAPRDARAAAGVLYELYLRSKEITWSTYVFAQDVDIDFISRVKELSLAGVNIQATTVREYHTTYAAHILGRTGPIYDYEWDYYKTADLDGDGVPDYQMDDTVGKDGVELAFESYLRGTPGVKQVERDTNGKVISETWQSEPEPGDNIVLTLDLDLQAAVEDILASSLPNLNSEEVEGAACVVLDVNNGEVLSCASYPTFDLANYSRDYNENAADPLKPFLNRALSGLYPPGSTFKMITAIAGLEEEIITPTTIMRDLGRYTYYSSPQPECWIYRQRGGTHGDQNVTQAITNSCNYFFYDVGRRLGIQTLEKYAAMFGLGEKTGIELSESAGVMAGPEFTESMGGTWYEGATLSVAIGQESTQVTPIQLANYIATLVNGGTRYSTHLLKEVKSSDFSQILHTYEPQVLSTVDIQEENLAAVKQGMLDLTTTSLARYFGSLGFQVGAKTGSAQVSAQSESNAVFVCFAPYDDPEIAVSIVVEHGGSGSELAAIAADILSYYFSSQGTREEIPRENTLVR